LKNRYFFLFIKQSLEDITSLSMHFSSTLLIAASAALAQAATISVAVGNGSLTFSPNSIQANVGDTVEFSFFPKVNPISISPFSQPKLTIIEPLCHAILLRQSVSPIGWRFLFHLHPHHRRIKQNLHHRRQ
jgi:hypothetical protein